MPHIATMGRDEILQQTPLKLHLIKRKNKAFLEHQRMSVIKRYCLKLMLQTIFKQILMLAR
ncbi:hypothetical protein FIM80_07835 [Helicobacter pylori]|nr:hypothetical protein FIM80_07835 [Helicobacter pylori]TPH86183.1 hypothetical protein FIM49_00330 [Helicobacter pylori]TPH96315.1 hypothetical protein FIM42_01925 [Helicobacter pylori]